MIFFNSSYFTDMLNLIVLCFRKVVQGNSGCNYTVFEFAYAESFKRCSPELLKQQFFGKLNGKYPLIKVREIILVAESLDKLLSFVFLNNYFRWTKCLQQLFNIIVGTLCQSIYRGMQFPMLSEGDEYTQGNYFPYFRGFYRYTKPLV